MQLTGFVLLRAVVDGIFAQIAAINAVAVPARFWVDDANDIIVASPELFEVQLDHRKYGEHPLAVELLASLGWWDARQTVEVTIEEPSVSLPVAPPVSWSVLGEGEEVLASGVGNARIIFH